MSLLLCVLHTAIIWAVAYTLGAREATRRAKRMEEKNIAEDDFGQEYVPRKMEDGSVYFEVVRK